MQTFKVIRCKYLQAHEEGPVEACEVDMPSIVQQVDNAIHTCFVLIIGDTDPTLHQRQLSVGLDVHGVEEVYLHEQQHTWSEQLKSLILRVNKENEECCTPHTYVE
jgi:hypothetical protein